VTAPDLESPVTAPTYALDPDITAEDARLFLDSLEPPSRRSQDGFNGLLLDALWKADSVNLDRLALGYPGLVKALRMYRATCNRAHLLMFRTALRALAGQA
jgi:hypothetical protein